MTFTLANGFTFTIDPVLAGIGEFNLYWYGFAYTFGFAGLWLWLELQRRSFGWSARRSSEACFILIVAIMLCGRLFRSGYLRMGLVSRPPRKFSCSGKAEMATHGLLLGSVIAAAIIAAWTHTPLLCLLDMLSVPAAFIFVSGGSETSSKAA